MSFCVADLVCVLSAVPDGLMTLMRDIGRGYLALCAYNCKEAISILSQLPSHHYNTGWVLGQIGRAHFELAEYMQVRLLHTHTQRRKGDYSLQVSSPVRPVRRSPSITSETSKEQTGYHQ